MADQLFLQSTIAYGKETSADGETTGDKTHTPSSIYHVVTTDNHTIEGVPS